MKLVIFVLSATLFAGGSRLVAAEQGTANSNTTIGANAMLSEGAAALLIGQWQRGVELTHIGLAQAVSQEDRAAGFANLCGGYAALRQFEKALGYCDQSL